MTLILNTLEMAFPPRKRKSQTGRVGIGIAILAGVLVGAVGVWSVVTERVALPFVQSASSPPPPSVLPESGPFRVRFLSFERQELLAEPQVQQSINSFLPGQGIQAEFPVETAALRFQVSVEEGVPSPVLAEVFIPIGEDENQRFPLIVYGAGTTGLDEQCAPTREDQSNPVLGNYRNQMIAQASQGYVVVMPNYEGLDNPDRIHYYFNSDIEARSLLGAAKALIDQARQERREHPLFWRLLSRRTCGFCRRGQA